MEDPSAAVTSSLTGSWNDSTTVDRYAATTEKHYTSYTVYIIADHILRYSPSIILVFGIFGNIMTIAIMRKMKSGDSTINLYFIALAVFDFMFLLVALVWDYSRIIFGFSLNPSLTVGCKISIWLYTGGMVISAWLLVCMTVHRALSVVWPHRVNVLCTQGRVYAVMLAIVVIFAVMYSHYLYGMQINCSPESGEECSCAPRNDNESYLYFLMNMFVYIDFVVYSMLPFIIMAASNTVLIWKLNQSVKAAGGILSQGDAEQVQAREKAARSVTVTVVVVSVAFLVLTLPGSLNFILVYFQASEYGTSGYQLAVNHLISVLSNTLSFVNPAINFYLYCLTGRRFREEFIKILCCGRNRGRRGAHQ